MTRWFTVRENENFGDGVFDDDSDGDNNKNILLNS